MKLQAAMKTIQLLQERLDASQPAPAADGKGEGPEEVDDTIVTPDGTAAARPGIHAWLFFVGEGLHTKRKQIYIYSTHAAISDSW